MNFIHKAFKKQEIQTSKTLSNLDTISSLMNTPEYADIIHPYLQTKRQRHYDPFETLCMFIKQALSEDGSCQNAVNQGALYHSTRSVATGGYCQARRQLDTGMVKRLCKAVAQKNNAEVLNAWRWKGRRVYLIDGTTFVMADTAANQEVYPQTSALAKGIGFPIYRAVGIVSLESGSLVDAAICPYHGKGASEQALLRELLHHFKPGDIVLADAYFSTYFLMEYLIRHGVDFVFVQYGARTRTTDFSKGEQFGKSDHLLSLSKPKKRPD